MGASLCRQAARRSAALQSVPRSRGFIVLRFSAACSISLGRTKSKFQEDVCCIYLRRSLVRAVARSPSLRVAKRAMPLLSGQGDSDYTHLRLPSLGVAAS